MTARPRVKVKARTRPLPTVVPFVPWEHTPNPKTVDMLRDALANAELGVIQAVAIVAVKGDRSTMTGFSGGYPTLLQGATVELQHRLVNSD